MSLFVPVKEYERPSVGVHQSVLADIVDLGVIPGFEGKPEHKVDFIFQVDENDKEGKRLEVKRRFTLTLGKKANLRKFLEAWRGRPFADDEIKTFDLMTLVGANAQLSIVHESKGDKTYANISAVMPILKSMTPLMVEGYVPRERKSATPAAGTYVAKDGEPF